MARSGKKPFVLPDFNQPFVSVMSVPATGSGCRLEANSLYIRLWTSGPISTSSPSSKTFTFPSNSEGWSSQTALPQGMDDQWDATNGHNGAGSLSILSDGTGIGLSQAYWRLSTTWEGLGVPAGKTVTDAAISSTWERLVSNSTGSTLTAGPYEVRDGLNSILIATLLSGRSVGPTAGGWTQQNGSNVGITNPYQASNTQINLRLYATLNASGTAVMCFDDITIQVTFI